MSGRRGTTNSNSRGSAADRLARRRWLLSPESGWTGNGSSVVCAFPECQEVLDVDTVTVDRWPVPGAMDGTYARDNIRPACATHNYGGGHAIARAKAAMLALADALRPEPVQADYRLQA